MTNDQLVRLINEYLLTVDHTDRQQEEYWMTDRESAYIGLSGFVNWLSQEKGISFKGVVAEPGVQNPLL